MSPNKEYFFPMFARLERRTPWAGGRMAEADVLTLEDAASMATKHAGEPVTIGDILRAAGRGEITLRAIVRRTAKVQNHDGGVYCNAGKNNENTVPAGAIPNLPVSACQHIAATGCASWRTFDGFELLAGPGVVVGYKAATLAPDEPDFETVTADCRVTGDAVHALADSFKQVDYTQPQAVQPAPVPAWSVKKPSRYGGYTAPLYALLVTSHNEGKPCPNARDVVEQWRVNKPAEVSQVLADSFDYYDSNGDIKAASLAAIREAIKRMTSTR